jgi:hypothetical protein
MLKSGDGNGIQSLKRNLERLSAFCPNRDEVHTNVIIAFMEEETSHMRPYRRLDFVVSVTNYLESDSTIQPSVSDAAMRRFVPPPEPETETPCTSTVKGIVALPAARETSDADTVLIPSGEIEDKVPSPSSILTPVREVVDEMDAYEEEVLLTFYHVKSPLEEAGFVFRKNLYCMPGMDPKRNSSAVLGQDYFTTEQAFRENLCAYGLEDSDAWTEDNRCDVETWIRYSIMRSTLRSKTHIPLFPLLERREVVTLSKRLGFRYGKTNSGSYYSFPGVKNGILGVTKFSDEKEFHIHLARFGLPDTCNFGQITVNERIRLETYLAEKAYETTL